MAFTVEQQDCLYWLGRYTERVYTTVKQFSDYFDRMIDDGDTKYIDFCASLEIPNIYSSREDFIERYCGDETNPDSIISNLMRGFDNALILREILGTDAFSYIQLAVYSMRGAALSGSPLIDLQRVCDHILSFWGVVDDSVIEDRARDLIKTGRRVERVDLYGRMHASEDVMRTAIHRLTSYRLVRSGLGCRPERIQALEKIASQDPMDYNAIVYEVENIFNDVNPAKHY